MHGRKADFARSRKLSAAAAGASRRLRRDIDDNGDLLVQRAGTVRGRTPVAPTRAGKAVMDRSTTAGRAHEAAAHDSARQSDTFIFDRAAAPGEWAVSGAFVFWNSDPTKLEGKARAAFRGGFLGVTSLGWSTLVQIVEATAEDRAQAVGELAQRLVERFGAPDITAATPPPRKRSRSQNRSALSRKDTLIAVHRTYDGEIREAFRTLRPRNGPKPLRAFSFMEVEGEAEAQPADEVDLVALADRERK